MTPAMKSTNMVKLLGSALADGGKNRLLELLSTALHLVMDAEVDARCGAGYGERSEERVNSRNGTRQRLMETTLGSIELAVPKLRKDSYFPSFVTPRRRWEQAFVNVGRW